MIRKLPFCLAVFLLAALALPLTVFADMGPKPMVTVRLENPPQGIYYLDLLIAGEDQDYENLSDEERAQLDPDMLAVLENFSGPDGHPGLAAGTAVPLFGKLTGDPDGDAMIHVFSYYAVPNEFRLILVKEDQTVTLSDRIRRDTLQVHVTWDFASNQISQPTPFWAYLIQLLGTLLPTLLIEGVLLLLFRFPLKENWLVFLLTNLATQLGLFLFLGTQCVTGSYLAYYFALIPAELIILAVELAVYIPLLKGKTRIWRAAYAVTANAASCAAGFFLAEPLFRLAMKLV